MDEFKRKTSSTLTIVVRNSSGTEVAADIPPTVTILDPAGATALPSTASVLRGGTLGTYDVTIDPGVLDDLGPYKATWTIILATKTNTHVEHFQVVDDYLFTISDLRSFDAGIGGDTATYTAAKISEARQKASSRIEDLCGRAFRGRGERTRVDGTGGRGLLVPHPDVQRIVAVDVDQGDGTLVAFTAGEISELVPDSGGIILRPAGKTWWPGRRNVRIWYEHGTLEPPDPIRHAAMTLARSYLVESPYDSRLITRGGVDGGFERHAVAGKDGPTGIPEVDSVIADYQLDESVW